MPLGNVIEFPVPAGPIHHQHHQPSLSQRKRTTAITSAVGTGVPLPSGKYLGQLVRADLRGRPTLDIEQIRAMEWVYNNHSRYISGPLKGKLAEVLGLSLAQIGKWFESRRIRGAPVQLSRHPIQNESLWQKAVSELQMITQAYPVRKLEEKRDRESAQFPKDKVEPPSTRKRKLSPTKIEEQQTTTTTTTTSSSSKTSSSSASSLIRQQEHKRPCRRLTPPPSQSAQTALWTRDTVDLTSTTPPPPQQQHFTPPPPLPIESRLSPLSLYSFPSPSKLISQTLPLPPATNLLETPSPNSSPSPLPAPPTLPPIATFFTLAPETPVSPDSPPVPILPPLRTEPIPSFPPNSIEAPLGYYHPVPPLPFSQLSCGVNLTNRML